MPDGMTYFHMSNPYKYDGWTYEWQAGRQLTPMTHLDELGVQDKKLEFSYDAAGLRTQKKYTYADELGQAVVETTDYILHGKLLTHQKTTTTVEGVEQDESYQLHFYYDAKNRPISAKLLFELYHCKFSCGDQPGARVDDLYAVCGQAEKCIKWASDAKALVDRLMKRESGRTDNVRPSRFEVGDNKRLFTLRTNSNSIQLNIGFFIVQPGVDSKQIISQMHQVLCSVAAYQMDTYGIHLYLICS